MSITVAPALPLSPAWGRSTAAAPKPFRNLSLEPRLLVAYSLIAVLVVAGSVTALILTRRRAARRRRLRGIKDYDSAR